MGAVSMVDSFLKYLKFEKRYSAKTVIAYETDLQQFQNFLNSEFDKVSSHEANHGLVRSWIVSLVENDMDAVSVNRKNCVPAIFLQISDQTGNHRQRPNGKNQNPEDEKETTTLCSRGRDGYSS